MTEEPLDIRRAVSALRRRRWLLLAAVCGCVLMSLLLTFLEPRTYVARAGVLLPPSAFDETGRPLRNMETEVRIASSAEVLDRAGRTLQPRANARDLRRRVAVRAVSADILLFRAEGRSARAAVTLANAVAREYIAYVTGTAEETVETSIAVLREQAEDLREQIRLLEAQLAADRARLVGLNPGSTEAVRQAAIIDTTRLTQLEASRQLASLETQIADARVKAEINRRGLRILEPATPPQHPSRPRPLWNIGIAGFVGLIGGSILVFALDAGDRRLRSRDDIARTVGAPVVASVATPKIKRVKDALAIVESWAPSPTDMLAFRHAYAEIVEASRVRNVVVVVQPQDYAAVILAFQFAVVAVALGTPTAFITGRREETTVKLSAACNAVGDVESKVRPDLWAYCEADDVRKDNFAHALLAVTVVVSEPDSSIVVPTWQRRTSTVLAVSSGFSTADALASLALACLDAGHPVRGIFVANPDPADRSIGRFNGPVTAGLNGHGHLARGVQELRHPGGPPTTPKAIESP